MLHTTGSHSMESRMLPLTLLAITFVVASLLLAVRPASAATTFVVDSTADFGDHSPGDGKCETGVIMPTGESCTLRAAIEEANVTAGADVIDFDIDGAGVRTIAPASELPKITRTVTINGYSQPGAQPNARAVGSDAVLNIELSGAGAPGAQGLVLGASNSTIKGLVINRWNQGIRIDGSGATGNRITGNFIGTDASGTQKLGNYDGVRLYYGSGNTIGGTTAAERNVISGNLHSGVAVGDGVEVKANNIKGNYIGTDASGTMDLGNAYYGINVDAAPNNAIGGTTSGARNVISGNDHDGVNVYARGTMVRGNYVGTDATGTKTLGNTDQGLYVAGANNVVGGATAGERNVVSGNGENGIVIAGQGVKVSGNYVGTDASGTKALGVTGDGVRIFGSNNTIGGTTSGARNVISALDEAVIIAGKNAKNNKVQGNYLGTDASATRDLGNGTSGVTIIDAPDNTVGGTTSGARNILAFNGDFGVVIAGESATGNRVLSNSIFSTGGLGIDLGGDGPTANDPGDQDAGPDYLQNKPVLSAARKGAAGTTTVRGTLDSAPETTFKVQFFSNPEGTDEGKTLLGSTNVSTNGVGDASFAFSTNKAVRLRQNITATVTGPFGTSEFSAPEKVVER